MEASEYATEELGQTLTGIKFYMIKGVKLDDILTSMSDPFSELNMKIKELELKIGRGKDVIYRAFDPSRFKYVVSEGTDRTPNYISPYDPYKEDVIYAGPLEKAMEYARRSFKEKGLACLSLYDSDKLEKVSFYAYKPKTSFKDALLGIICLSDSKFLNVNKLFLKTELLLLKYKTNLIKLRL